ncbi:MAG TPA: patatin-like phospholipase family protein [Bacteroidia bacterium]|nr:patatin-like phospholipase family protein [Bacteroidia bacterium]
MRNNYTILLFLLSILVLFHQNTQAQKIGVVLSGGGAGGACHVGVLKALEENNIPIDYITGTSIGALIGGYYAAGYSIEEIEKMVTSEKFVELTRGYIEKKYQYYFFRKEDDASWITLKVSFDSSLVTNIQTNVINPIPIDFEMVKDFSNAAAAASYNFDSLFVPFRCVASDIENKKSVVFKDGKLNQAIRASMTYPMYLKPISVNGKILFDGGLYNNFPADVMNKDFNPDYIIGSVVTSANPKVDEENLYAQLRSMLINNPDFSLQNKAGIIIKSWSDVGTFNFNSCKKLIDSGYVATNRQIDSIRKSISISITKEQINEKRKKFKQKFSEQTVVEEINIEGLSKKQQFYVKHVLQNNPKKLYTLESIKKTYFRLAEDPKIQSVFPTLVLNPQTGKYILNLKIKRQKDLFIQFGGNISTRPISTGFVSAQYNYFSKMAMSIYINGYFGRLNTSGLAKIRFDFPSKLPIYIEPLVCFSRWDYYRSSTLFYNFQQPAYLTQNDKYGELNIGVPIGNKSRAIIGGGVAELNNIYYQTSTFSTKDTADQTRFQFVYGNLEYEYNSLNRKLYASEGGYFSFKTRYVNGLESLLPGTTSKEVKQLDVPHEWVVLKMKFDGYLKPFKFFKVGILAEGVYSTQNLFLNYTSSVLSAPAFMPTPESRTLFLPNFRAYQYMAGGGKMIFNPIKKIDIRFEAYIFQPYQAINDNINSKGVKLPPSLGKTFADRYYVGMAAIVYHTALGPLSLSVNYYHGELQPFTFLAHFGYTLFNRKSIE